MTDATLAAAMEHLAVAVEITAERLSKEIAELRAVIEAVPPPSDWSVAFHEMAEAIKANTAAVERLVDERVNADRMSRRHSQKGGA